MIKALRSACKIQDNHEPFGKKDLKGSLTALLKREFIDVKTITNRKERGVLVCYTFRQKNTE